MWHRLPAHRRPIQLYASKAPSHSQVVDSALPAGTTIPSHWIAGGNSKGVDNNWLKSFHDPRLDAIVAEAIANNLDLRQAAAKVEVARQDCHHRRLPAQATGGC